MPPRDEELEEILSGEPYATWSRLGLHYDIVFGPDGLPVTPKPLKEYPGFEDGARDE
jgi:hypothetical protein